MVRRLNLKTKTVKPHLRDLPISKYVLSYSFILGIFAVVFPLQNARAVPSFAEQTGQPCSACHIGAFGPQLKPFGRDFKLYGYVSSDGKKHFPPLAVMAQGSFTQTKADQATAPAPSTKTNNNLANDQLSIFYAGRITPTVGAFVQVTRDGIYNHLSLDNMDLRHAQEGKLFGKDTVFGVTVNNSPTMSDIWNSTPVWGFPYTASAVAPTPAASTFIDGSPAHQIIGAGAYTMWNDWIYAEFDGYRGLDNYSLTRLGETPDSDIYDGIMPYWRVAIAHEFNHHNLEFGSYGMFANVAPGGDHTTGNNDHILDVALDANYQWLGNPNQIISAHSTYIHERLNLDASQQLVGSNPNDSLSTFRADVSYDIKDTYIPSVQYFRTWGSSDANYWGTTTGSPNSEGFVAEIAYVPFGKQNSDLKWMNARLALQYVAYREFDGTRDHASDNNTLYLQLWMAAPWQLWTANAWK